MIGVFEALAWLFVLGKHGAAAAEPEPSPRPSPKGEPEPSPKPAAKTVPAMKPTEVKLPPGKPEAAKPWPVATKPDLPAYPTGWEPYTPPPPAVVTRAKALIPTLWASGKVGVTRVEQTNGVWVTYVSFRPTAKLKGVAAYRLKDVEVEIAPATVSDLIPVKAKAKPKPKALAAYEG